MVLFHIAKVHGIHWSRIGRKDSQEKATSLGHFSDSLVHGLTTRPGSWWPEFVCMYIYIYIRGFEIDDLPDDLHSFWFQATY